MKVFLVALSLVSLASSGLAQSSGEGLLGQRYATVSVGGLKTEGFADHKYFSSLSANLPVARHVDVGFGYGYSRTDYALFSGALSARSHEHTLALDVTAYCDAGRVRPFASLGLGYFWLSQKFEFSGVYLDTLRNNDGLWSGDVGIEIPFGRFVITPRLAYEDAWETNLSGAFSAGTAVHYWLSRSVGLFATVRYWNPRNTSDSAWQYGFGSRLRF